MIYGQELFQRLNWAQTITSRGMATKELVNTGYTVPVNYEFFTHPSRKLKLDYVKQELLWYFKGDRYDTSITQHAKAWLKCIDDQGGINSNYGQYLLPPCEALDDGDEGNSLAGVIWELFKDKYSRRAVTTILGRLPEHFRLNDNGDRVDVPCTTSLQFLVRPRAKLGNGVMEDALTVIATMRSQDAVWGAGNDIPCFMLFGKLVARSLNIPLSALHVNVGSLHIYERHFEMAKELSLGGWHSRHFLPELTLFDVECILDHKPLSENSALGAWLSIPENPIFPIIS